MSEPVYLDFAAATPVDPEVADAMHACLTGDGQFGNPHADTHAYGRAAGALITRAGEQVATLINAPPEAIVWTSGATEADNLALLGAARFRVGAGRHIITSVCEHPAVLEACRALEKEGFGVTRLTPDANGVLALDAIQRALQPDTVLVSVAHANNEIGVVQDIASIGKLCRDHGALFHVDAAQSAGRLPIDVDAQAIDLLSLSAQKIYGPKGVGALYLNRERIGRVAPLMYGGGQQRELRPGTIPTHQVVGMGLAFELAGRRMAEDVPRIVALRDQLWGGVSSLPGVLLNGDPHRRVCHILSVSVTGVEGESLHLALAPLAVSAGSACAAATAEPSAVLRALGRSDELARSTVRFSLGRTTTAEQIEFAADVFREAVERLRGLVPAEDAALA